MSLQPVKFLLFGSLGLSLFLGNSIAIAQSTYNSNGDVVVPTTSNGGSTGSTVSTGDRYPSGSSSSVGVDSNARFSCQQYNGQYTVMYSPQSQPGQAFAWANPRSLGGGWDTARRCNTIAQRLETYRRDGLLELQTSVENGQNVVCVTTEANPACRIVLTVPPEKDPYTIRNSVFENLASADNGQQTFGVNTYRSQGVNNIGQIYRTVTGSGNNTRSSNPISLKPFLDRADGGTATSMRNGVRIRQQSKPQSGARLQPGKFR